jgi:Spy/CpxP family protein refolding chaperone
MKKFTIVLLCLCFALASSGLAEARSKSKDSGGCKVYNKFYSNTKIIMSNSAKLGISDAQIDEVRKMKYDTKKNKIKACADIKIVGVEISEALWKEKVDIDKVNALIDKKYQMKAQLKKDMVGSYVSLNEMLTADQKEMVKSIRKAEKCDMSGKYNKQ